MAGVTKEKLDQIFTEFTKFQHDVRNLVDYVKKCQEFALRHGINCDVNGNISYEYHGVTFDLYTVWKKKEQENLCL